MSNIIIVEIESTVCNYSSMRVSGLPPRNFAEILQSVLLFFRFVFNVVTQSGKFLITELLELPALLIFEHIHFNSIQKMVISVL